jgi:hypothetical protein
MMLYSPTIIFVLLLLWGATKLTMVNGNYEPCYVCGGDPTAVMIHPDHTFEYEMMETSWGNIFPSWYRR